MARKKRLALALPDEADQVLTEISEILNKPKTTIVTEIFLEALPTLQIVAKMLAEANEKKRHDRRAQARLSGR